MLVMMTQDLNVFNGSIKERFNQQLLLALLIGEVLDCLFKCVEGVCQIEQIV